MQDRVPVNPGRVLITPEDGSPAYYATMTRADNPTQEGTRLNKASLLKDVTASLFGFDENAVPNDIFSFVGQYNTHWWSVLHGQASIAYEEKKTISTNMQYLYCHEFDNKSVSIQYSDTISINQTNGSIALVSPSTVQFTSGLSTSVRATRLKQLYGKYVTGVPTLGDNSTATSTDVSGKVFFIVDGASYFAPSDSNNAGFNPQGFYTVTSQIVNIPAGKTTYEHSVDRNAYPDSGTVNGLTYQYLGVPFDNAVTAPKIATGTYKGTGSYGSGSKNSLTFDFVPKIVFVVAKEKAMFHGYETTLQEWIILVNGMTKCLTKQASNNSGTGTTTISWSGNTVSWYGSWAGAQLNTSGVEYLYVALG